MRKAVIFLVVAVLFLAACSESSGAYTNTKIPDDHTARFEVICDTSHNIGMWVVGYGSGNTAIGYAVRMTDAEYETECSKYE